MARPAMAAWDSWEKGKKTWENLEKVRKICENHGKSWKKWEKNMGKPCKTGENRLEINDKDGKRLGTSWKNKNMMEKVSDTWFGYHFFEF